MEPCVLAQVLDDRRRPFVQSQIQISPHGGSLRFEVLICAPFYEAHSSRQRRISKE